jgi:hypothetical protein
MSTQLDIKDLKRQISIHPTIIKEKDDRINDLKGQIEILKKKNESLNANDVNIREKLKKYKSKFLELK